MFNIIPYRTGKPASARSDVFSPFADSFFRTFFGDDHPGGAFRVDVEDKGDSYLLTADLPGACKDCVSVEVDNGILTITAEADESRENNEKNYVFRERRYGVQSRSFNLEGVDENAVTGEFKNGVLHLTLPKKAEENRSTARRIELQ